MANLFDYLKWRGDLSLSQSELCDVDRLILSELCYMDFPSEGIESIPEHCRRVLAKLDSSAARKKLLHHKQDEQLLMELSISRRFEKMLISDFVSEFDAELEVQFAAMCVILSDNTVACIFRGTDWSLIGWKEDFNMAHFETLPSQRRALSYLETIGEKYKCPIRVMGHSKGGHLAIFASSFCNKSISDRIIDVTSLDGPGFGEDVISSDGYKNMSDRIRNFIPRSSIVGALFMNTGRFSVVESQAKSLMQHIPYNWEVIGSNFVTAAERDGTSQLVGSALNDWIASLTPETRKRFIDTVWSLLDGADITELGELLDGRNTFAIVKKYNALDEDSRKLIGETLTLLRECAKDSLIDLIEHYKNK